MDRALQYLAWAVWLWLNGLVISALLRGEYRRYPFAFAYAISLVLATVVEIAASTLPNAFARDLYYWVDEGITDILVFCVVISFIDNAAKGATKTPIERGWLVLAAALIFVTSLLVHRGGNFNLQMTLVSRDLNIAAVLLDLVLWSLLVTSRRPDRTLLLLSGGLGIQASGSIMSGALVRLSRETFLAGSLLGVITGLLGLYIWWRAFRTSPVARPVTDGPRS